jgi:hypothetical protein
MALALKPDAIVIFVYAGNDFIQVRLGDFAMPALAEELPVPSILGTIAPRRPPTASADTRCSGQKHLQGTALDRQPLLTGKLLIQIGSQYSAPIAFNVHDVIPKLEQQPPHPFGGASTQHYSRHRKRRQSV